MGTIYVEGLGNVQIAGDTPTEAEQRAIAAGFKENKKRNEIDITPLATAGDETIDKIAKSSYVPAGLEKVVRAALKTPRDVAYLGAQALAVPFVAAKHAYNALTFPLDVFDSAAGTNMGRAVRDFVPEVKAGTAPEILGSLGAFAGTYAGAPKAAAAGMGWLRKLGGIPQATKPVQDTEKALTATQSVSEAVKRALGGGAAGAAVTDPDGPMITNLVRTADQKSIKESPALWGRGANFVEQGALLGLPIEAGMAIAPPLARAGRNLFQGAAGNVERGTAEGLQAAAGGRDAALKAATENASADLTPFRGANPTSAEVTTNTGLQGLEKTGLNLTSRASNELQAPGTVLAERNAANQQAARSSIDDMVPANLDETLPLSAEARRGATDLEGARNSAGETAARNVQAAEQQSERNIAFRQAEAERDALAARGEYEDLLGEVKLPRKPGQSTGQIGDASEKLSTIVDDELERLRALKNEKYAALKTDEPVNPERIVRTLAEIKEASSKLGKDGEVIANSGAVRRLEEALAPAQAMAEVDALALQAAKQSLGGKGSPEAINNVARDPRTRQWAAAQLGVDLEAAAAPTLTTTDLLEALPNLTAEISALRAAGEKTGQYGAAMPLLQRLKSSMSIRNERDVAELLGTASPETVAAAQDAIQTYGVFADRFKTLAGRAFSVAKANRAPIPPSSVAEKYLSPGSEGAREKVAQLLDTVRGAPDEATRAAGEAAIQDWLLGQLGARVVKGEVIKPAVLRKFREDYSEILRQGPQSARDMMESLEAGLGRTGARMEAADQGVKVSLALKPGELGPTPSTGAPANASEAALQRFRDQVQGRGTSIQDLRARVDQFAQPSTEEVAINALADKLGKDPVAVFKTGIEAPRPMGDEGLGPLLKLARIKDEGATGFTPSAGARGEALALRKLATLYLQDKMGANLGGAAEVFANPKQRQALAAIYTPSELARLEAVNAYAAKRQAIASAPSTGTFPTLKTPGKGGLEGLYDFLSSPGKATKIARGLRGWATGDSKAIAERALVDALTNPDAALRLLRLNLNDEGKVINFLKGYSQQPAPAATLAVEESVREMKRPDR